MNNINEITLGNSLALKFECEIILKNCIIDITDDVYKNCIFTDNYIFFNSAILLKHRFFFWYYLYTQIIWS